MRHCPSAFLIFFPLCHRSLIPLNWNVPKWSMAVRNDQPFLVFESHFAVVTWALCKTGAVFIFRSTKRQKTCVVVSHIKSIVVFHCMVGKLT